MPRLGHLVPLLRGRGKTGCYLYSDQWASHNHPAAWSQDTPYKVFSSCTRRPTPPEALRPRPLYLDDDEIKDTQDDDEIKDALDASRDQTTTTTSTGATLYSDSARMRKWKVRKRRRKKTLNFVLGLPWGQLSTPDPPVLETPRTQASEGPEAPCPSS